MKVDGFVKPVFFLKSATDYLDFKKLVEEKIRGSVYSNVTREGQVQATCTITLAEWEHLKPFLTDLEICS